MNKNDPVDWKIYVDQRFNDQDKAVNLAREADKQNVAAALVSQEKAVLKKEEEVERWRANANEWRGAMSDRERDFLTRREFYVMLATAITITGFLLGFVRK